MVSLIDIPTNPGCYLYRNKSGKIIYVGKAKNLKKRVSNYFQKKDHDSKTRKLVENIDDIEIFITKTEVEALLLENNLIKKHQPKYNINLKDDKRYAYLKLSKEEFPRISLARKKDYLGEYFGPYTSGMQRDFILERVSKTFRLRTCKRMPKKACLRYHMGYCSAPCIGAISKEAYNRDLKKGKNVLKGDSKEVIKTLNTEMKDCAKRQDFETAILKKNQIEALTYVLEKQNVELSKTYDQDVFVYVQRNELLYVIMFNVSRGVLLNKQSFEFDSLDSFEDFISRYYSEEDAKIPREIIVPIKISKSIEEYLSEKRNGPVSFVVPQRGIKKELLDLAFMNLSSTFFAGEERIKTLQEGLKLKTLPRVIECFDISHLSGTNTVASMVQFKNGMPSPSNYRRFKIKTVKGVDDFRSMFEVVTRRYSRLKREVKSYPDLIVIDGGKGQLAFACDALRKLDAKIPIISLAKREEEVFKPGRPRPYILEKNNKGLHLLQHIRDEAHRFAITYNRLLRKKELKK